MFGYSKNIPIFVLPFHYKLHFEYNLSFCAQALIFGLNTFHCFNFTTAKRNSMNPQSNPQLELAFEYVRNTRKNIFLTGKAGTGKTTFLRSLQTESTKRMVIVASTGVAAINAGGMTIHSFFQLPFGPYLPGKMEDPSRMRRFTGEKIRLIKSLDLLVIDEISMVRSDVLDGIDEVLRRYRDRSLPFGGVQLLMIGDLHQLPPVVKDEEWNLLREHYRTAYFFGSHALQQTDTVRIELKHIYRQSDSHFIELLNKVRDNKIDEEVLSMLNSRYVPNFQPKEEDAYITLTAHNASAREINGNKLAELPGRLYKFNASISGEFPSFAYPTDEVLECKVNAQVMFVKNDVSQDKRYYNGKIGKVVRISDGTIYVKCPGDQFEIDVKPDEWKNVKYSLDEQSKEVKEETLGTFTHHPLKLAWAITIHKSQGLTFERAIIDAQAAFAHGQVYVALSRCKSFEGIVLHSKIVQSSVRTDTVVKNYTEDADKNAPDEAHLTESKAEFQQTLIRELFDFNPLRRYLEQAKRTFLAHENTLSTDSVAQLLALEQQAQSEVISIAQKFRPQMEMYFLQGDLPEHNAELQERIQKACVYFEDKVGAVLLPLLKDIPLITDNKTVEKAASEALDSLHKDLFVKTACFSKCKEIFVAQQYLQTKANAEIDYLRAPARAAPKKRTVAIKTNHPELYHALLKWREDTAAAYEIEPYLVLPSKALEIIVELLPISTAALKKVKGIGQAKIKQFGTALLTLVKNYVDSNQLQEMQLFLPDPVEVPKPVKTDSKVLSLEMFKEGKSIDEIAAARGFVPSTIEGHLAHFVGLGELDVFDLISEEKYASIADYLKANEDAPHSEVKATLGEEFSYGEIKLVWKHLEWVLREEEA
jgi:tRNA uridine 5-carbamoylmethylation protein Kti12